MRRPSTIAVPVTHLTGPGTVKVINGRLAFAAEGTSPLRLETKALREVHCYGEVGVTGEAMTLLLHHGVQVSWLTAAGMKFKGRVVSAETSATLLRIVQHRALSQPKLQREWACGVVQAKIDSQAKAARHYQRQGSGVPVGTLQTLKEAETRCATATLEQLRGIEGGCASAWFGALGAILRPPWVFTQRNRRPPRDPVNALLSLGYTWLLSRVSARCAAVGMEVNLGGLHEYRPGRPSLACDMMEPLRAPGVDRWVVKMCNQNHVRPEDFVTTEKEGTLLSSGRFGRILQLWEEWWRDQDLDTVLEGWLEARIGWLRAASPDLEGVSDEPPDN